MVLRLSCFPGWDTISCSMLTIRRSRLLSWTGSNTFLGRGACNSSEDALVHALCLILLCPNDHEGVLASSLEHVYRLLGLYQGREMGERIGSSLKDFSR